MNMEHNLRNQVMKPLIVIPLFNHAKTLRDVAERCLKYGEVLIVDDGSTDNGLAEISDLAVATISHTKNKGKGQAILTAADYAIGQGKTHIVTIDADGQHFPEDIPLFLEAIKKNSETILVGSRDFNGPNVPGASKFGRNFSNFWLRVQTGSKLGDVQSGFRAYPLEIFTVVKNI